ncbi:MAG: malto-oligosyltrehalose trehalohydrolase [Propionivibrio sp.]|nr:malto-oligosyltrehalose trehalohydrolase [Propionivibrio sp.]
MKRKHAMPFGAEPLSGGGVRFRLWAPGDAVSLQLDDANELPMLTAGQGWFEFSHPTAHVGSRYRFRLPDGLLVPDPVSRSNPDDVHGASEVIDPTAFDWSDDDWRGRPWEEAVIYELHIGCFTSAGDFNGVIERLDYLVELGVTALEILPVADFPGRANWGYDGVLLFAPDAAYGRPDDFKRLIDAAHERGLMVLLDVVYNHFGPEGNYLHAYAKDFFNPRHATPWGAAINFDSENSRTVREFFVHNVLYWLEEFHLDGLRLDAIHAICDDSSPDIIEVLAEAIKTGPGRARHVHMVLENERNQARYLGRDCEKGTTCDPLQATAQWNDDIHHVFHVLATGETDGYYTDYADQPARLLARCLTEGFAFQGEASRFADGELRGEPSAHLPPAAFINFLQNHDQIGNRAFGERLSHLASPTAMEALTAVLLLAPQPPMLFMGEEFATTQPFLFFCDFGPELANAVTEGRRREFSRFARFADPAVRESIPDPNAAETFKRCVLDWSAMERMPQRATLELHRQLLVLRRQWITPRLAGMGNGDPQFSLLSDRAMVIHWRLGDSSLLTLLANLGENTIDAKQTVGTRLFATSNMNNTALVAGQLPPWSAIWHLQKESR